jgi:hypothetical protein
MKIVWDLGQAKVRDVYETLLQRRKIAYTTVMTMMKILEDKKHLKKNQEERAYVYRPSQPKNQVERGMVREFVDRVFNGSAEPLLGASGGGPQALAERPGRACPCDPEAEMSATLLLHNLVAYSLQLLLIGAMGGVLPAMFRLRSPKARRIYWQVLLVCCLALPVLEPWGATAEDRAGK